MFKNFCEWDDSLSSTFCCSTSFSYTSMFFSVASLRRKTFMPLMQDCKSLPSSVTRPYHWNYAETQHSVVFPLRVWMIVLLLDDDVFLFCLWGLHLLNWVHDVSCLWCCYMWFNHYRTVQLCRQRLTETLKDCCDLFSSPGVLVLKTALLVLKTACLNNM